MASSFCSRRHEFEASVMTRAFSSLSSIEWAVVVQAAKPKASHIMPCVSMVIETDALIAIAQWAHRLGRTFSLTWYLQIPTFHTSHCCRWGTHYRAYSKSSCAPASPGSVPSMHLCSCAPHCPFDGRWRSPGGWSRRYGFRLNIYGLLEVMETSSNFNHSLHQ